MISPDASPLADLPQRGFPASPAGVSRTDDLRGDVMGGCTAVLVSLPMILSCGAVVYLPLGSEFVTAGVVASFVTAIAGAVVPALLGGRLHVNAPRPTQAALLAAMMGSLATQPDVESFLAAAQVPAHVLLIAAAAAALLVAGTAQLVLGLLRLGDLVKYVPQTIVAGFVTGFVIQIVAVQAPLLFGAVSWAGLGEALSGASVSGYALAIGVLAGAVTLVIPRISRHVPAALAGLAAGTLVDVAVQHLAPGLPRGPVIGTLPAGLFAGFPTLDLAAIGWSGFPRTALFTIVSTGLTLALITSLQSLLSAAAADTLFRSTVDGNRELVRQGGCTIASALLGGTATGGSPLLTRAAFLQGGRTRRVNAVMAVALLVLAVLLREPVGAIPLSVLAAVVIIVTFQGVDDWTKHLVRAFFHRQPGMHLRRLGTDLAVLLLVSAMVAFVNVLAALGVGMVVTVGVFLRRSAGSPLRRIYFGDMLQSNTVRSNLAAATLEQKGQATAIVELQGALFFGSAEALRRGIEEGIASATCVILDCRRVTDIDSSCVLILERLDELMAERGCRMLIAGFGKSTDLRQFLTIVGFDTPERQGRVFDDLDVALASAEDRLLEQHAADAYADAEIPLAKHPVLADLSAARLTMIEILARRVEAAAGEAIYREGEPATAIFLLAKGAATRQRRLPGSPLPIRQTGYRPGALFGEAALLRGGTWDADVIADTQVVYYRLMVADLLTVDKIDPWIALAMLRNIAGGLMDRIQFLRQVQWTRVR